MKQCTIATFYKFISINDCQKLQVKLLNFMRGNNIKGTIILATEGINGTIAGSNVAITAFFSMLGNIEELQDINYTTSYFFKQPFLRSKVKIKPEIVTLRVANVNPHKQGEYVAAANWNTLISDPDVLLIDTRNTYEYEIGTFKGAINPNTENFRDFPDFVAENLQNLDKDKKIAMFCTGGIRCEKSTAYMKQLGFNNVYHLKGGILKYLAEVPETTSLWQGECFVFDDRVAVGHNLEVGSYDQCHGCRFPITEQDKLSIKYRRGIHCPRCYEKVTAKHLSRVSERQKQIDLAKVKNQQHLGS